MPERYDALVVGSGTAGQTAAYHLNDEGLKVGLVEHRLAGQFRDKTHWMTMLKQERPAADLAAERDVVDAGVLTGYVLSSYTARRLGLETTGNAGGVRNLLV